MGSFVIALGEAGRSGSAAQCYPWLRTRYRATIGEIHPRDGMAVELRREPKPVDPDCSFEPCCASAEAAGEVCERADDKADRTRVSDPTSDPPFG